MIRLPAVRLHRETGAWAKVRQEGAMAMNEVRTLVTGRGLVESLAVTPVPPVQRRRG
ncbi:MAG: hypothetical protein ACRDP5_12410 [Streptosporangiaceae bacterium]